MKFAERLEARAALLEKRSKHSRTAATDAAIDRQAAQIIREQHAALAPFAKYARDNGRFMPKRGQQLSHATLDEMPMSDWFLDAATIHGRADHEA